MTPVGDVNKTKALMVLFMGEVYQFFFQHKNNEYGSHNIRTQYKNKLIFPDGFEVPEKLKQITYKLSN